MNRRRSQIIGWHPRSSERCGGGQAGQHQPGGACAPRCAYFAPLVLSTLRSGRDCRGLPQVVVSDNEALQRICSAGCHVARGNVSDKFRSLFWIDNRVPGRLVHGLIIGPLGKFLPTGIAQDKIKMAAVVKRKCDRFFPAVDKLQPSFQRMGVGKLNHLRSDTQPHLETVVDRTRNWTERAGSAWFDLRRYRPRLAVSGEGYPSVKPAG